MKKVVVRNFVKDSGSTFVMRLGIPPNEVVKVYGDLLKAAHPVAQKRERDLVKHFVHGFSLLFLSSSFNIALFPLLQRAPGEVDLSELKELLKKHGAIVPEW